MSRRNHNVVKGQFPLLEPEELFDIQVVKEIDGTDVAATYGKKGSYVNVAERAVSLIAALEAMSERNRRDGLSLAAYTEPYSAPIWEEYREYTELVLDGASRNRNMYQQQLRVSFWEATGFAALRGTGLIQERQINPRAQKMWRDFNAAYGHPSKVKERAKYKSLLKRQLNTRKAPSPEQLAISEEAAA